MTNTIVTEVSVPSFAMQHDELASRIEKISMRLVNDNDGYWSGELIEDPYMEDHLANIEGYLELYGAELEYSASKVLQAKRLLAEALTLSELGRDGPFKTKVREFLKSLEGA